MGGRYQRLGWVVALAAVLACGGAASASAEKLRVGKPQAEVFSFVQLDIRIEQGIFAKHGL